MSSLIIIFSKKATKQKKNSTRLERKSKTHLSVIGGTGSEESLKRVVTGNQETGKVDEELASDVEENQEEVDANQTQDRIDLGDVGLALQVVKNGVLRELYRLPMVSTTYIFFFSSCHISSIYIEDIIYI